ncbi:uncharacterized protein LOC105227117 [Bactrocera dorsalis]|uniref:Uncharacterized protein LOC105227117 n=1 Tax=Bactrocera dorsalis TaxID=27457 RepID=A0ABM3K147_BACDO|nr:uncharacterized protein LOC105227117 [Bactrocera dorsalis]XP_049315197.1 uncharacterized protein LOC105227117 [Bactrocera dorsalis]
MATESEPSTVEHESNESDEDCEVYFLKPVNEYNIVEKIKEANKVLFEETTEVNENAVCADASDITGDSATETEAGVPLRKVTFAPNLETYEPDNALLETLKLTREFEEAVAEAKELDRKLATICEYQTITEETNANAEEITNTEVVEEDMTDQKVVETLPLTEATQEGDAIMPESTVDVPSAIAAESTAQPDVEDDIMEEICEEIVVMDMENKEVKPDTMKMPVDNPRRMVKMRTFDCAEEDPPDINEDEQDNKSLTNLLTSDGEEECCSAATFDINDANSDLDVDDIEADTSTNEAEGKVNMHTDEEPNSSNNDVTNTEGYDQDDDDDDLSIIVASYLPDDFDQKRVSSGRRKPINKSRRLLAPLSKRFSFRGKSLARNAIGTTSHDVDGCSSGHSATARARRPHLPPPEVTDLKLNYRTCCEYRRHLSQPEKLPKYTGYLSEYGLSRQQLEVREENLQRQQRYVLQQALKANDAEMRKMQDNERAFTTWLRNKMRFPINKTRNMFDVKHRSLDAGFGSGAGACGGNSAVRNASGKRK